MRGRQHHELSVQVYPLMIPWARSGQNPLRWHFRAIVIFQWFHSYTTAIRETSLQIFLSRDRSQHKKTLSNRAESRDSGPACICKTTWNLQTNWKFTGQVRGLTTYRSYLHQCRDLSEEKVREASHISSKKWLPSWYFRIEVSGGTRRASAGDHATRS